jgi:hypothetical protein
MDRLIRFGNDVANGWLDAGAFTLAASLAYYAIFSIAPLLLISIHLASLFLDRSAAVEGLTKELVGLIGPTGSDAIKQMLDAAGTARPHGWTGLVGIAVLLFAAAGFVGSLQDALDKIWEAPPRPDGVWSFLRNKLFSFSLVLAAAFLLLVSLVLSTGMTALTGRFTVAFGLPEGVVETAIAAAFGVCYVARGCRWRRFYRRVVRAWPLRACLVSGAGSRGIRLRSGDLARTVAHMDLLLCADSFSWRPVFSKLPERRPAASRRWCKSDCRRAPARQFDREILFKFGGRSRSGLPARSCHDAKASGPAPPRRAGLA